jgi:hypothetical protein
MKKSARSTKANNFRLSAIQENRQRISRSFDAEEQERQRLVRLNKLIEQAKKSVIEI